MKQSNSLPKTLRFHSAINKAFGLWKDREFDTETYIREIRKGKRLDKLSASKSHHEDFLPQKFSKNLQK